MLKTHLFWEFFVVASFGLKTKTHEVLNVTGLRGSVASRWYSSSSRKNFMEVRYKNTCSIAFGGVKQKTRVRV